MRGNIGGGFIGARAADSEPVVAAEGEWVLWSGDWLARNGVPVEFLAGGPSLAADPLLPTDSWYVIGDTTGEQGEELRRVLHELWWGSVARAIYGPAADSDGMGV